jgi:predicted RNA-binding protein with PIN domain
MAVLIDGFNLIYKFPHLESMMYENRLNDARKGLLEILDEYNRIKTEKINVIFDGKKNPSDNTTRDRFRKMDIYYSIDYSADYLIKELVKKNINPKMLTVVTSDKDIIVFAERFRAKVVKSERFAAGVLKEIEDFKHSSVREKEDDPHLSQEEISYWEKIFKKKKE